MPHKAGEFMAAIAFAFHKRQLDPFNMTALFTFDTVVGKHQQSGFSADGD